MVLPRERGPKHKVSCEMKKLISADTVRAAHAAGEHAIYICTREHIVTPEAHVVAERLGVILTETPHVVADASQPSAPAMPVAVAESQDDEQAVLAEIRAQILARLPAGAVTPELVDQLVRKAAAEHRGASQAETASLTSLPRGPAIKCVHAQDVRMGLFDGAGPGQQVGIADLITAADGSSMAAGFMQWENAFFPWTLNYDEVDLVMEGELHIRCNQETTIAKAGDVIFIPKGSSIEFGTPTHVRFLYVAYPANWQSC